MKSNKSFLIGVIIGLFGMVMLNSACTKMDEVSEVEQDILTEADKGSLLFMLEEEKMARDIYTSLHELWGANQFLHIKESEQRHMDYVRGLLDDHGIAYSIADPGVFQNSEIQSLHDELMLKGRESKADAFVVGATIEDIDIFDLQNGIENTLNTDIKKVYQRLMCGSNNHMRAFVKGLTSLGWTYTPEYISMEEYNLIINSDNQHCD